MNVTIKFIEIFKNYVLEASSTKYQVYTKGIMTYSQAILNLINLESISIQDFCSFYSIYCMFRNNKDLSAIMQV